MDYPAYSEELFYDKAGNRARRLVGGEEELYQYDPRNRLMALTRGGVTTPFQYDNAGNLLQDDKARYSYDAFNRTVKVETFDGNVQVNRYDAEGLRHEMEENGRLVRFIFHKGEAVVEHEENSNVIRLIRGSELIARSSDSESARTYYHYASDEMGSTTHIVDESGNVQNRYAYDAWGKIEVKEEAVALPTMVSRSTPSPSSITCGHGSTTRSLDGLLRRIPTGATGLTCMRTARITRFTMLIRVVLTKMRLGTQVWCRMILISLLNSVCGMEKSILTQKLTAGKKWGAINLLQPRLVKWVALIFRQGAQQPLLIVLLSLLECRHLRLEIIYIMIL